MSTLTDEQLREIVAQWLDTDRMRMMANELIALRAENERLRSDGAAIDAALETWFYPGEFDSRVKAVQETARVWDGIVAALDIGDSDADVAQTIRDMVEYAGDLNAANAALRAENERLREDGRRAQVHPQGWFGGPRERAQMKGPDDLGGES